MAKLTVTMPDDFIQKCASLGSNTDAIMGAVLKAGGEIILEKARSNLRLLSDRTQSMKAAQQESLLPRLDYLHQG